MISINEKRHKLDEPLILTRSKMIKENYKRRHIKDIFVFEAS